MSSRVDPLGFLAGGANLGESPLGFREHGVRGERIGDLAGRPPQGIVPHPLGPGMKCGVGRGPIGVRERPNRLSQALVSAAIEFRQVLDHLKREAFMRQEVGWEYPDSSATSRAPGQREPDEARDDPEHTVGVGLQKQSGPLDDRLRQPQARGRGASGPSATGPLADRPPEIQGSPLELLGVVAVGCRNGDRHGVVPWRLPKGAPLMPPSLPWIPTRDAAPACRDRPSKATPGPAVDRSAS